MSHSRTRQPKQSAPRARSARLAGVHPLEIVQRHELTSIRPGNDGRAGSAADPVRLSVWIGGVD